MKPIKIKRIYEPVASADGYRVLIDKLWPRGVSSANAKIDLWLKQIAPSDALRKWFGHEPAKWPEFRKRYAKELENNSGPVEVLTAKAKTASITLLYAAKKEHYNNAVALKAWLARAAD